MRKTLRKLFFKYFYFQYLEIVIKQTTQTEILAILVMEYLYRRKNESYYLIGDDEYKDKVLWVSIHRLCELDNDKPLIEFEVKYKKEIEETASNLRNFEEEEMNELRGLVFQIQALRMKLLSKKEESKEFMQKAKKLNDDAAELNSKDLNFIEKKLKKRKRQLRNEVRNRRSYKIDFKLKDVIGVISLMTPFFLISGYLYNALFLGYGFDINVSHYFSLADYLGASVDKIQFSVVGAVLYLIGTYIKLFGASRETRHEAQLRVENKLEKYSYILATCVLIIVMIVLYSQDNYFYFQILAVIAMMLSIEFAFYIAEKFFTNKRPVIFVMIFVISFFSYMLGSTLKDIHEIKSEDDIEQIKKVDLKLIENSNLDISNMVVLNANSQYFFLYDIENKNVAILPKENIKYIEIVTPTNENKN